MRSRESKSHGAEERSLYLLYGRISVSVCAENGLASSDVWAVDLQLFLEGGPIIKNSSGLEM